MLESKIRYISKYKKWRKDVLNKNNICQSVDCVYCGNKPCYVEVHHIVSIRDIIINNNLKTIEDAKNCSELWSIDNAYVCCFKTHIDLHRVKGFRYKKRKKK